MQVLQSWDLGSPLAGSWPVQAQRAAQIQKPRAHSGEADPTTARCLAYMQSALMFHLTVPFLVA